MNPAGLNDIRSRVAARPTNSQWRREGLHGFCESPRDLFHPGMAEGMAKNSPRFERCFSYRPHCPVSRFAVSIVRKSACCVRNFPSIVRNLSKV